MATNKLFLELCNSPITTDEILLYILQEEPKVVVLGDIRDDEEGTMLDATAYTLHLSATKGRKVDSTLVAEYMQKYGVSKVPLYNTTNIDLYFDKQSRESGSSKIEEGRITEGALYGTIVPAIRHSLSIDPKYSVLCTDIFTLKNTYNRRIACVKDDPQYATKKVQAILQKEYEAIVLNEPDTYIRYAYFLLPSIYYLTPQKSTVVNLIDTIDSLNLEALIALIGGYNTAIQNALL